MFSQGSAKNVEWTENKEKLTKQLNCLKGGFYFTSSPKLYIEKKYCNCEKIRCYPFQGPLIPNKLYICAKMSVYTVVCRCYCGYPRLATRPMLFIFSTNTCTFGSKKAKEIFLKYLQTSIWPKNSTFFKINYFLFNRAMLPYLWA